MDEQNGFLHGRSCIDASFALKMALQERRGRNLDSYVLFVDLVKAFDSVNRQMLLEILRKYGIPEKLIDIIRRLHTGNSTKFKINGVERVFECRVGVKQGDNLAPILFIFVMQALFDSLENDWPVEKPKFCWAPDKNWKGRGKLLNSFTCSDSTAHSFNFWKSLYADDGAIVFTSREDLVVGSNILFDRLKQFGMKMHVGKDGKKSKTEALFIPGKSNPDPPANSEDYRTGDGYVSFTKHFNYLGSYISNDLSDDRDVQNRISKASKNFRSLKKNLFCNNKIPLHIRRRLFLATTVNQLLWGCESWAITTVIRRKLNTFFNKCVRFVLRISMYEIKEKRIHTYELLEKFDNILSLDKILDMRRARWLEKVLHMDASDGESTRLPRKLLCSWTNSSKRPLGRPEKNTRASYCDLAYGLFKLKKENNQLKSKLTFDCFYQTFHMKNFGRLVEQYLDLGAGTYKQLAY